MTTGPVGERPVARRLDLHPGAGINCHQQQQYHARAMTFPDLAALKDFAGWKAARAPHAVGPGPDQESLRLAYLGLLKLALCDLTGTSTGSVSRRIDGSVASRELRGEDRRLRSARHRLAAPRAHDGRPQPARRPPGVR